MSRAKADRLWAQQCLSALKQARFNLSATISEVESLLRELESVDDHEVAQAQERGRHLYRTLGEQTASH